MLDRAGLRGRKASPCQAGMMSRPLNFGAQKARGIWRSFTGLCLSAQGALIRTEERLSGAAWVTWGLLVFTARADPDQQQQQARSAFLGAQRVGLPPPTP